MAMHCGFRNDPWPGRCERQATRRGILASVTLNGLNGPGAPILGDDKYHPGRYGYDYWLSVTNYFDMNPVMSRNGSFNEFKVDSSEIIVSEALEFISRDSKVGKPFFVTIWYGSPHRPFVASEDDQAAFSKLKKSDRNHCGELVALDRSIGRFRKGVERIGRREEYARMVF